MTFNNIHIIIGLIIIIIFSFIYNYDIHVTQKGEKLCKDVLVEKKNIKDIKKQNEIQIIDIKQNDVINNVMKILENIPSNIDQDNIQLIVSKINSIYQSSNDIEEFNKRLSELPNEYPYNTKYAKLVSNLIIKFDTEINNNVNNKVIDISNNKVIDTTDIDNKFLKKSKKKNKKVSFNDSQNTDHIYIKDNNKISSENNVKPENFNNIGEFTNYAPF